MDKHIQESNIDRAENSRYPEISKILSTGKDRIAITGSVAFNLQAGVSFNKSIEVGNDIDILEFSEALKEEGSQVKSLSNRFRDHTGKEINFFSNQQHIKNETTKDDVVFVQTEIGSVPCISVRRIVEWELENMSQISNHSTSKYFPEQLRKRVDSLTRMSQFLGDSGVQKRIAPVLTKANEYLDNQNDG